MEFEQILWLPLFENTGSQIVPPIDEVITTDTDINITIDNGQEITTG